MSRRNQEHSKRQRCRQERRDLHENTVESTDDMQSFIDRAFGMPIFIDEVGGLPIPSPTRPCPSHTIPHFKPPVISQWFPVIS